MAKGQKRDCLKNPENAAPEMSDPGQKPELKWIAIDKLVIDAGYQRPTTTKASRKNLEWMQANFSWAHCGALLVCPVPKTGNYAVIDGQHRMEAARARGDIGEMPCIVMSGREFRQQAESFVVINTRRVSLNNLAKYHAAVSAGDADAMAVQEFLAGCGIEIPKVVMSGADTGPRQTQAIATLAKALKTYRPEQVQWAITLIPEAYGEKKGMIRASLIKALSAYIAENPDAGMDRPRLAQVLGKIDPDDLERSGREYVKIDGGTTTDAMVKALTRHFRVGMRVVGAVPQDAAPSREAMKTAESYIGRRDAGGVHDSDWDDIRHMTQKGAPVKVLATKYGVGVDTMKEFIDRKLIEDARDEDARAAKRRKV